MRWKTLVSLHSRSHCFPVTVGRRASEEAYSRVVPWHEQTTATQLPQRLSSAQRSVLARPATKSESPPSDGRTVYNTSKFHTKCIPSKSILGFLRFCHINLFLLLVKQPTTSATWMTMGSLMPPS